MQHLVAKKVELKMLSVLMRLMHCAPFKGRLRGPEDELSIAVANMLRAATLEKRLEASWTCIPHEVGSVGKGDPAFNKAQARYAKAKAQGLITGSADYVFVWPDGGGWIELKSPTGSLSPEQRDFRDWNTGLGIRWAKCKTIHEVIHTLIGWGILTA